MVSAKDDLFWRYKVAFVRAVVTGQGEHQLKVLRDQIRKQYPQDLKRLDRKLAKSMDGTTPYSIIKHRIGGQYNDEMGIR